MTDTTAEPARSPGSIADVLPDAAVSREQRRRLKVLGRRLDALVVDDGGRVAVSRRALDALLDDRDLLPADAARLLRRDVERRLPDRLVAGGRPAGWGPVAQSNGGRVMTADELREIGVHPGADPDEAAAAVRRRFPDLPKVDRATVEARLLGPVRAPQGSAEAAGAEGGAEAAAGRSVLDCCIAHLGWWAVMMIVAVIGAAIIMATATGPFAVPLTIWLVGMVGGATAVLILNCIVTPNA